MARDYWFAFGSQPSVTASLSPTFITFINGSGTTYAPPAITETFAGSGLYKVNYGATQTMSFVMDGATTGLDSSIRYIFGVFDPQDTLAQTFTAANASLVALGMTGIAIGITGVGYGASNFLLLNNMGTTLVGAGNTISFLGGALAGIGDTSSPYGSSAQDPSTLFGYAKRIVEFLEGNSIYTKATGGLTFSSRNSATLLASKTVSDTTTTTTKS
jgi:hypothetical protein